MLSLLPTTSIGTKHVGSDLFSADIVILGEACHTRSHRSGATRPLDEPGWLEQPQTGSKPVALTG